MVNGISGKVKAFNDAKEPHIDRVVDNSGGMLNYHYDESGAIIIDNGRVNPGYTVVIGEAIGFINSVMLIGFFRENVNA